MKTNNIELVFCNIFFDGTFLVYINSCIYGHQINKVQAFYSIDIIPILFMLKISYDGELFILHFYNYLHFETLFKQIMHCSLLAS